MSLYDDSLILRQRANEARRDAFRVKLLKIFISVVAILLVLVYVVSVMNDKFGSFTISINKYEQLKYGLSLSETYDFANPTARLNCRAAESITHFDGKDLDSLDLGAQDGEDSGSDYLCYTFYVKNSGTEIIDYRMSIIIAGKSLGVEKAIRVRMITNMNGQNKTQVDYARAAGVDDQGNAIPEEGTEPFYTDNKVMEKVVENFKPDDIQKITVVIWIEGNDPDCIDPIIGGEFKIDMKFEVVGVANVE